MPWQCSFKNMLFCSNYAKNYASTIRQGLHTTPRKGYNQVNLNIIQYTKLNKRKITNAKKNNNNKN